MNEADPVRLEVFRNLFAAVAEEMGVALRRSSYSPNIKERCDFSCAVFDADGEMIAQAAHIPVHLGSMPLSVRAAIDAVSFEPGDAVILNDPYAGGTHLPDITLVSPVFDACDRRVFLVANRAHHSDVGGMAPGSLGIATDIIQEGVRIPPLKLVRAGQIDESLLGLVLANVRTPDERRGDLAAQLAANRIGERRLHEMLAQHPDEALRYAPELLNYAERLTRRVLRGIPDGEYAFEDCLDDDGIGREPVRVAVVVRVRGDEATFDFGGSAPQTPGPVNAVFAVTLSCVSYVLHALAGGRVPPNSGCLRPVRVVAPAGSVVNAAFPAAVAAGNVETSQRIVDVVLGALAQALPDRVPAASCGTMTNVAVGGVDPRMGEAFTYYETIAGGMGGRPDSDGLDGVHCHMTNTLNTPIEALELAYPLRVTRYAIRDHSGGEGRHRGGHGLRRDLLALAEARASIIADRHRRPPYGLRGGRPGQPGQALLIRDGEERRLPSKCQIELRPGDVLSLRTPGGGGWGEPDAAA